MNSFRFQRSYALLAVLFLVVEILIATFLKTGFIRHTFGDFLVVILIYCFVKSFWNGPYLWAAIGTLLFAYLIEISQYLHLIDLLGLKDSLAAKLILGNSFSWDDMLAYTLGILCVIGGEWYIGGKSAAE